MYFLYQSLPLRLWDSNDTNFIYFAIVQQVNFCSSGWIISIDIFFYLYTPFLSPFFYRAPPSECFISDIALLVVKFPCGPFLGFYFPIQYFYFSIHFKNVYLTSRGMVIMAALTSLLDNSSQDWHLWLYFPLRIDHIFLVLCIWSNLGFILGDFNMVFRF